MPSRTRPQQQPQPLPHQPAPDSTSIPWRHLELPVPPWLTRMYETRRQRQQWRFMISILQAFIYVRTSIGKLKRRDEIRQQQKTDCALRNGHRSVRLERATDTGSKAHQDSIHQCFAYFTSFNFIWFHMWCHIDTKPPVRTTLLVWIQRENYRPGQW